MHARIKIIPFPMTLLFLLGVKFASCQEIERKIIVKNKIFYYTTINKESQLATLHMASIQEPFSKTKSVTLPAGRNDNDPIIPFCWDIGNKNMFAVNFITNAMNSRNNALKLFPVSSLSEQNDTNLVQFLQRSFDLNTFTFFQPLEFVTNRSAILENFFFDGILLNDSSLCMAVSNRDKLTTWFHKNGKWEHSNMHDRTMDHYFTLFTHKNNTYLVSGNGEIDSISFNGIHELPEKRLNMRLQDVILIINKDEDTIQILERKKLTYAVPFTELIQKNAIPLF